ncbi:MAG TPA: molybdopterin-binding protein [Xanthobacteraceae bacterium]|nr:molybdopterin-binding protein [Xanthobacteraceae bacterium]
MQAQRISSLTPIGDVLARVAALARPVAPREMPLAEAEGRVLAQVVRITAAWPAAPIALIDGWAVRAAAIEDAGPYAPVPLSTAPARVDAGDALPSGADAVLPLDAVTIGGDIAEVHASATVGDGVLEAGADAGAGQMLRYPGAKLRAIDVAALQAVGVSRVAVREPRVRVVSVGADPTALAIARAVASHGANVIFVRALERALAEDADAIVAIGGTGAGRDHHSVEQLARAGQVDIHGFGLSPGETSALGGVGKQPVLLLPARLDAALAAFLVVGEALLRGLTDAPISPGMPVALRRKITSTVGLAEVVPVCRGPDGVEPLASGYWPMQAIARADGWVLVPPESEGYPAGTRLEMRAFP